MCATITNLNLSIADQTSAHIKKMEISTRNALDALHRILKLKS